MADPCVLSPCLHGGACAPNSQGFACSCTAGFTGSRCESPSLTLLAPAQPLGQLSCSECVGAGKFYGDGVCAEHAADWMDPATLGVTICSATHGLVQGQECCDAYAEGRVTGGSMHIHISGGGGDISAESFGGCDLTQLSMKCGDVDPSSSTFCQSACREMAVAMTDDCSREGLSITQDALAANPTCPYSR